MPTGSWSRSKPKPLDKSMISPPTDFRHLAHVDQKTQEQIDLLKNSGNVLEAVNENNYYSRPISISKSPKIEQNVGLDAVLPLDEQTMASQTGIRSYENQPTTHSYQNVVSLVKPSKKKYKAPPPPPPTELKPKLIDENSSEDVVVVFRKASNVEEQPSENYVPNISTPNRIEPPKANSIIIDRPGGLGFKLGLDDEIPVSLMGPIATPSPLHRPLPKEIKPVTETPILSCSSPPPGDYMSTIRSTSAQGTHILDDLDDWLDQLDFDDREKLSRISTDESGYPTLALAKDRQFMKQLVEKYELNMDPETIRIRSKKTTAAPPIPGKITQNNSPFLPNERPVSMPSHPNRPPPDYDAPSFDSPQYLITTKTNLYNGRELTKQNALDIRSSSEYGESKDYLHGRRKKRKEHKITSGTGTISSDITDFSTTSSRWSTNSIDCLSEVGEEDEIPDNFEIVVQPKPTPMPIPIPKPRTRKLISNESVGSVIGSFEKPLEVADPIIHVEEVKVDQEIITPASIDVPVIEAPHSTSSVEILVKQPEVVDIDLNANNSKEFEETQTIFDDDVEITRF